MEVARTRLAHYDEPTYRIGLDDLGGAAAPALDLSGGLGVVLLCGVWGLIFGLTV